MSGFSKNHRSLVLLNVDGEEVRARETHWVVYNPAGDAVAAFPSDATIKDAVDRAARSYWYGDKAAILALNEGYKIKLMTNAAFYKNVAATIKPEN